MTDRTAASGIAPVASGHRRPRVRTRAAVGIVLATVALLVAALGVPAGAASSSPKAQLQAAAAAMQQVPGYTFSASVGNGAGKVKIAGEYQAPDRIHEVVQIGTKPASELVLIGSQAYAKDATGAWQRAQPTTSSSSDLRTTFAALKKAGNVKKSGKAISFTLSPTAAKSLVGAGASGKVTGRATINKGQITELRYATTANGRKVPVKITYKYTTPAPTVTAPL